MFTLEEAKAHLRVDYDDEDTFIQQLITAAADHLSSIDVDVSGDPLPPAVRHAVWLLVGHFFENRAATSEEQIRFTPIGVDRLIAPCRSVSM